MTVTRSIVEEEESEEEGGVVEDEEDEESEEESEEERSRLGLDWRLERVSAKAKVPRARKKS